MMKLYHQGARHNSLPLMATDYREKNNNNVRETEADDNGN